jgi:hypothetical protein
MHPDEDSHARRELTTYEGQTRGVADGYEEPLPPHPR